MALLNELLEEAAARSTELAQQAGGAAHAVTDVAGAARKLSERLQASRQGQLAAMDALEAQARQETAAWLQAADQAIGSLGPRLVACGNRVLHAHNAAVAAVRTRLAEEAAQEANAAVIPLETAVVELYQLCAALELTLADEAAGIRAAVEAALAAAQRIEPVLETSGRLA